jgi:hypothetical protein
MRGDQMLKLVGDFTDVGYLPQESSDLNGCHITGETPVDYSLTCEDKSFTLRAENEKPEPPSSGSNAMNGIEVPPIIADSHLRASGKIIVCQRDAMNKPFVKLYRQAEELLENDWQCFLLLTQIALRAIRVDSKYNKHNLKPGQAFVGDCRTIGLSEQQYRDAKYRIQFKYKIATFKGTNKGTIATLLNSEIYDINIDNEERTREQTKNGQGTDKERLIKNVRSKECKKKEKSAASSPKTAQKPVATEDGLRRATLLFEGIKKRNSDFSAKDLNAWAIEFERLHRLDGVTWQRVDSVLAWLPSSDFWWRNVLSGAKFRQKFQRLEIEVKATSEDKIVVDHRRICLEAKKEYPNQFKHMQINRDNVVNLHNQKDVPFRIDTSQFKALMNHVFNVEFE